MVSKNQLKSDEPLNPVYQVTEISSYLLQRSRSQVLCLLRIDVSSFQASFNSGRVYYGQFWLSASFLSATYVFNFLSGN